MQGPMLKTERMDDAPIVRKYTSFDEMKADEYRYWQSRPAHERLDAVEEMIEAAYGAGASSEPRPGRAASRPATPPARGNRLPSRQTE